MFYSNIEDLIEVLHVEALVDDLNAIYIFKGKADESSVRSMAFATIDIWEDFEVYMTSQDFYELNYPIHSKHVDIFTLIAFKKFLKTELVPKLRQYDSSEFAYYLDLLN